MSKHSISNSPFKNVMAINDNISKRVSSWDPTGGNSDWVVAEAGETIVLADIEGPGIINHFYVTMMSLDLFIYRRAVIRMFWDDEESPSVEVPLGDFFGIPFAQPQFFQSQAISVNPGRDGYLSEGLNIYFPMPFAKRARIELFNDSPLPYRHFWYHINYEEAEGLEPELGYFHASWRRENQCERAEPKEDKSIPSFSWGINETGEKNFTILEAQGRGNYAGCILQIDNMDPQWYGEGDDMIFIDGETWPPSLHGTGTEEIFGGGACPNEPYCTPWCGYHQVEHPDFHGRNAMYKFFIADPVRFKKSIRVSIEHGHANNLGNDYAATAYWYQHEPHGALPALPDASKRIPRLPKETEEPIRVVREAEEIVAKFLKNSTMSIEQDHGTYAAYAKARDLIFKCKAEEALEAARQYRKACEEL